MRLRSIYKILRLSSDGRFWVEVQAVESKDEAVSILYQVIKENIDDTFKIDSAYTWF